MWYDGVTYGPTRKQNLCFRMNRREQMGLGAEISAGVRLWPQRTPSRPLRSPCPITPSTPSRIPLSMSGHS